jgi:heptaprenyl diphosphate synthase
LVEDLLGHLLRSNGKLFRPRLTMSVCYSQHPDPSARERALRAAASVELLHLGTLYHDDVIDRADERRGVSSCNKQFGNVRAVLGGDLLISSSLLMAALLGRDELVLMAETLRGLCVGQISESARVMAAEHTIDGYFRAIGGKTAHLIQTAMTIGAHQTGLSRERVATLSQGAWQLGLAFQILDDVLDLVGSPEVTGKACGQDLREGVVTLPLLLAAPRDDAVAAAMAQLPQADAVDACITLAVTTGGVASAADQAFALGEQALAAISSVLGATDEVDGLIRSILRREVVEAQIRAAVAEPREGVG